MALPRPCICLITDRRRLSPGARTPHDEAHALLRWLAEAVGHVDLIQIRERDLGDRLLHELTRDAVTQASGSTTRILVNDRPDIALAAGAGGVHLRADGIAGARVRRMAAPGWIIGRSTHSAGEAGDRSLDYVLFGSVFVPAAKPDGVYAPQGAAGLASAVAASACPVLAVGGVSIDNAALCAGAGAAGVAAISLFLPPDRAATGLGIRRAAAGLREALARNLLQ